MKVRAYAPLLIGSAAILVVVLVWLLRSDRPTAPAVATKRDERTVSGTPGHAPHPLPVPSQPATLDAGADGAGRAVELTLEHDGPPAIDKGPDKPPPAPLSLDEKLGLARKHIIVMRKRADDLKADIGKDERAGRVQQAADKRVRLKRLEAQINLVQGQIDAGVDPSLPQAEQQPGGSPPPS